MAESNSQDRTVTARTAFPGPAPLFCPAPVVAAADR